MPALQLERLTKRYGDLLAVDQACFAVSERELFGILRLFRWQ